MHRRFRNPLGRGALECLEARDVPAGFADDFSSAVPNPAWSFVGGTWAQAQGGLAQTVSAPGDPRKAAVTGQSWAADQEVVASVRVDSWQAGDYARAGVGVRTDATGLGYNLVFHGTNTVQFLDDHIAWGNAYSFAWQVGAWYRFRLRAEGTTLSAKVWAAGTPEPAAWMFTQSGWADRAGGAPAVNGGSSGLGWSTATFDDFAASDLTTSLFADDFAAAAPGPAWSFVNGTWGQGGGIIRQTGTATAGVVKAVVTGVPPLTASEVEAKVRVDAWQPGDYARAGVGLGTDPATGTGYNLVFHGSGQVQFLNDYVAWGNAYALDWQPGAWYHFRLRQETDGTLRGKVWADGQAQPTGWQFVQTGWPARAGRAALNGGAAAPGQGSSTVSFDDAVVRSVGVGTVAPTTPAVPSAPTGLQATAVTDSTGSLAWTDNASNETGYAVERSADGSTFAAVGNLSANATAFTDAGLSPMTTYFYRVRAVNAAGASDPSAVVTIQTPPRVVRVGTTADFRAAVVAATPGTRIELLPGVYDGNNYFNNVYGADGRPVVIAAADPAQPPVIRGGYEGLHFSDTAYLEVRDLIIEGAADNGINIDDGGTYDTPSHHVLLSGLTVRNVGSSGNSDGIKLSGLDQFTVEWCNIQAWGAGGSGIDMVGCHDGLIAMSYFRNGDAVGANGLEMKGGSARVVVRGNRFEHAGSRAVQIGGSTELAYFRPEPDGYEAKDVTVERNVIVGSEGAVAFVTVDGATVRFNTIYRPTRYAFRILQETNDPAFVPCRNGVITDNIVAFRADEMLTAVNIGPATAPETFQFARNWWYCVDQPALSVPSLPAVEVGGTYGIDPQFINPAGGDFHLVPGSPASGVGAYA